MGVGVCFSCISVLSWSSAFLCELSLSLYSKNNYYLIFKTCYTIEALVLEYDLWLEPNGLITLAMGY